MIYKNVILILPTYNERDNIATLISKIEEVFEKLEKYKLDILVVDDRSPDGTTQVVEKLILKYKNIRILEKAKEGLGAAYVYGMNYAIVKLSPDLIVQMDADWSHNPLLLPQFIDRIEKGADFVIGSRYISGGSIPGNWGIHRKIYSIVGNSVVRFGLGKLKPHDWTSGFRMMKVEVYKKVNQGLDKYSGYTFQVAFLDRVIKANFTVAEVPLQFIDRIHGRSKIAPSDYIKNVLLYVFHNSAVIKYLIIGTIGFTIQSYLAIILVDVNLNPDIAVTIGAFCAIVANFLGNNLWTFSERKINGLKNLFQKFVHFFITSLGAVAIQGGVVSVGIYFIGKEYWFWLMVFAIIFLVIPYNFFIYNRFIWKNTK